MKRIVNLSPVTLGTVVLILVVTGYGLWRSSDFLLGPKIIIEAPIDGGVVLSPIAKIKGRAERISAIFLNDQQIFTDNQGYFEETLLLAEGYNIIEIRAKDRFGRETERIIKVAAPAAQSF